MKRIFQFKWGVLPIKSLHECGRISGRDATETSLVPNSTVRGVDKFTQLFQAIEWISQQLDILCPKHVIPAHGRAAACDSKALVIALGWLSVPQGPLPERRRQCRSQVTGVTSLGRS